jgi:septum site-determining protein MinC
MTDANFRMKGTNIASVILDLYQFNADDFAPQLQKIFNSAPQFFNQAPLVINFSTFEGLLTTDELDFIVQTCKALGLQPIACKALNAELLQTLPAHMNVLGLANLPPSKSRETSIPVENTDQADVALSPLVNDSARESLIISRPVRSGQQIYAENTDLIILAAVNEGAEIIADGNIHVYGALRGRAIAGAQGNTSARIFSHQMEAELVSIAGNFILNETLREQCWKKPAQVYLEDESIIVSEL